MYKLHYNYVFLPQKVRLISKSLRLDHIIYPDDFSYYDAEHGSDICMSNKLLGYEELFKLSKTNLFDNIYVYLNESNMAYYYRNNKEKINLSGWIDINQFSDGGHYSNDKRYYKEIFKYNNK